MAGASVPTGFAVTAAITGPSQGATADLSQPETSPEPAAPRHGFAAPRAPRRRRITLCSLQVEEEHVPPQPLLARSRFDPGQVHPAVGELAEAADQPPRRVGPDPPEDDRGLEGALRSPGPARPPPGQPDEAGFVAGGVLHSALQDATAVALGRQAVPECGPRGVMVGNDPHGFGS